MLAFSPLYLLLLVFLGFFIPGAIFALGILRNKDLALFDKIGIGLGIGIVAPPLILTILSLLGIGYSFGLALFSILLFYAIAIATFYRNRGWEGLSVPSDYRAWATSAALALIAILAFWIRLQSYSPVYMELDPYFYLYHTEQILTDGIAPFNDGTAWYPLSVNHRIAPIKAFAEATMYSLYTGGAQFELYMLSDVASIMPPIYAALAVLFIAIFISSEYRREFGVIAAGVASFIPMFILKLSAGEFEVQPNAFFGLAFFFAMYALAVKRNDRIFAALAGFAYLATMLSSSSVIVIITALLIFIPLQALVRFFTKESVREFVIINGIVMAGILLSTILNSLYGGGTIDLLGGHTIALLGVYAFACAIYFIRDRVKEPEMATYTIIGLLVAGIVVMAFTPIGSSISGIAMSGLSIAKYNLPLHRTIAEQGTAGASFEGILGFIAMDFKGIEGILFAIPSFLVNAFLSILVWLLNSLFNVGITFTEKTNSMLLLVFFFTILALAYSFYRKIAFKEWRLPLLFAALIFPIAIVGLLKTKYTIYLGFVIAVGFGVALGEIYDFMQHFLEKVKDGEKRKKYINYTFMALLAIGAIFVFMEFSGPASLGKSLLVNSFATRYQDNPMALQAKFQSVCTQYASGYMNDPVCLAADDPEGYASLGVNQQFDPTLCMISITKDITAPTADEQLGMSFRCMTMSYYWIDLYEWVMGQTPEDARFTSWWDYGHWTNYFGQRNTVLRNEHTSHEMIVEVAHGLLYGEPHEIRGFMQEHDSEYLILDQEILGSQLSNGKIVFGGKYGALNYLSCARNNETTVDDSPGYSACEMEHLWEQIYVPRTQSQQQACAISPITGKSGVIAYRLERIASETGVSYVPTPYYCLAPVTLADGTEIIGTYYLDRTSEAGELKLNKGLITNDYTTPDNFDVYTLLYTKDEIWLENGEAVSGWEDRKGRFYDSVLYQGFVLKEVPGFELVYMTPGEEIKLFKIK